MTDLEKAKDAVIRAARLLKATALIPNADKLTKEETDNHACNIRDATLLVLYRVQDLESTEKLIAHTTKHSDVN